MDKRNRICGVNVRSLSIQHTIYFILPWVLIINTIGTFADTELNGHFLSEGRKEEVFMINEGVRVRIPYRGSL
jgi:hypothetical protein